MLGCDVAEGSEGVGSELGGALVWGLITGACVDGAAVGATVGSGGDTLTQPVTMASARAADAARREVKVRNGDMAELWTRSLDICFFTVCPLVASRDVPSLR